MAYYLGSKRVRVRFSDLDKARAEAQAAAVKLANGEFPALQLTGADRATYVHCLDAARALGKPLNLLVAEYSEAVALLPEGISLKEAVREFARRSAEVRSPRTVSELAAEFIAAKEKAGMSPRHLTAGCRLARAVLSGLRTPRRRTSQSSTRVFLTGGAS